MSEDDLPRLKEFYMRIVGRESKLSMVEVNSAFKYFMNTKNIETLLSFLIGISIGKYLVLAKEEGGK
ncbi:MAG: hypothetical protein QXV82_09310 [Ignisphaera sp.]